MTTVALSNYLVPATGSTNAYIINETFVAGTPKLVDFNTQSLDGVPFRPSGVILDNTNGVGDLVVLINEVGYRMVVPAGASVQMQYPAPVNHTATITGDGQAVVVFVDYPVIPFDLRNIGSLAITIGDGDDVALGDTSDAAAPPSGSATLIAISKYAATQLESLLTLQNQTLTPSYLFETGAGTVAGGAQYIRIQNIGVAPGDVLGVSLPAGDEVTFAPHTGTISAVSYDATGTTFLITSIS